MFITLTIGIVLLVLLIGGLYYLASADPAVIRKYFKYGVFALTGLVIMVLLKFGLTHMAVVVSFMAAVFPLLQRMVSILLTFRMLGRIFKRGTFFNRRKASVSPAEATMTRQDACHILGVPPNASPADIKKAYQTLMKKYHPDAGGSEYFATKLNEAKEILLKK